VVITVTGKNGFAVAASLWKLCRLMVPGSVRLSESWPERVKAGPKSQTPVSLMMSGSWGSRMSRAGPERSMITCTVRLFPSCGFWFPITSREKKVRS
jgi:hypothetical protein